MLIIILLALLFGSSLNARVNIFIVVLGDIPDTFGQRRHIAGYRVQWDGALSFLVFCHIAENGKFQLLTFRASHPSNIYSLRVILWIKSSLCGQSQVWLRGPIIYYSPLIPISSKANGFSASRNFLRSYFVYLPPLFLYESL